MTEISTRSCQARQLTLSKKNAPLTRRSVSFGKLMTHMRFPFFFVYFTCEACLRLSSIVRPFFYVFTTNKHAIYWFQNVARHGDLFSYRINLRFSKIFLNKIIILLFAVLSCGLPIHSMYRRNYEFGRSEPGSFVELPNHCSLVFVWDILSNDSRS